MLAIVVALAVAIAPASAQQEWLFYASNGSVPHPSSFWGAICAQFFQDNPQVALTDPGWRMRLEIFNVQPIDYFRPIAGENLCTMLQSNQSHEWSQNGDEPWLAPAYYTHPTVTLLGGSAGGWLRQVVGNDTRNWLPFWGADGQQTNGAYATQGGWGRPFLMYFELPDFSGPTPIVCGNCAKARRDEAGCENPAITECMCSFDPFCCDTAWDSKCVARVLDYCNFQCVEPEPVCEVSPSVPNAEPFTTCAGTQSREFCDEAVQCDQGMVQWGEFPFCYAGSWIVLPACLPPAIINGHLWFGTLDGLLFAYHKTGVVRMWESPENNMELQIRTLRPAGVSCDATLTAQVAFRAGDQVIAVVGSRDEFEIWFNNVPQNLTTNVDYSLGSGPDELLVQYTPTSLSITSKRGARLQIIFYEMEGMSWLAIPHSLDPRNFYGNTRGLLGVYDGDASNDFTSRNGTVFPVVSFNDSNGEQTGFGNSWIMDDSESLFGPEQDAIANADAQYNGNPPGAPSIECPTEFPNVTIPECDEQPPGMVAACYFDVVLGGEQFLDDVLYQPACGNNTDQYCSFHGSCVDNVCVCTAGWSGVDCEVRTCPAECIASTGSTGECDTNGLCQCRPGFTGTTCQITADCSAVNDCNAAEGNGACVDTNVCECSSFAYDLPDCSLPPLPTTPPTPTPEPTPTLLSCGATLTGSNVNATNEVQGDAGDVVFTLGVDAGTAGVTINVVVTTCDAATDFDTHLFLYRDADLTDLIAQNDDGPRGSCSAAGEISSRTSSLNVGLTSGNEYYLVVTGYGFREGNFGVSSTCTA